MHEPRIPDRGLPHSLPEQLELALALDQRRLPRPREDGQVNIPFPREPSP